MSQRTIMAKIAVIVFITLNICVLLANSQGFIEESVGDILVFQLREDSETGGMGSQQSGAYRDMDSRDDYSHYRDSLQQRQQSQKSGASDGVYTIQKDARKGDSRSDISSSSSWDSGH